MQHNRNMAGLESKGSTTANDGSRKNAATPSGNGGDQRMTTTMITDDDELFELDITLLNPHDDFVASDDRLRHSGHCAAVVAGDHGHALLANCLLPVSSVSNAVPVAASSIISSYPYSGYYSSRRLFTGSSRRFLGRPGNSARFCFSSRGFETMGNYFQRCQHQRTKSWTAQLGIVPSCSIKCDGIEFCRPARRRTADGTLSAARPGKWTGLAQKSTVPSRSIKCCGIELYRPVWRRTTDGMSSAARPGKWTGSAQKGTVPSRSIKCCGIELYRSVWRRTTDGMTSAARPGKWTGSAQKGTIPSRSIKCCGIELCRLAWQRTTHGTSSAARPGKWMESAQKYFVSSLSIKRMTTRCIVFSEQVGMPGTL
ncbi:uncharacterized protein LOC133899875 isoform X1 [Phragmites australis]|uniref:uncharacterized protein LOC133899875 isoform X1 n=1 Tax=Phragmites australis TaxID=29695 RepID=UPI002D79862A|nr:uncharacterized protein LOC133899875 isoform X1 [Phragmites australis]